MSLPAYYFPNSALKAQAACATVWEGGLLVPLWTRRQAYNFSGGGFALLTLPPGAYDAPISPNDSRVGNGYFGAAADGSQGAWISASAGLLAYLPYSGTASGFSVSLVATGDALTGLAVAGVATGGNTAYAVGADGRVFMTTSAAPGTVTTLSPGFNALCKGGSANATNLYTTLPSAGALGIMALAGHAVSSVSTPFPLPGILSASASGVAVGGWSYSAFASGAVDFQTLPSSPGSTAAFANSSTVALFTGSDPYWSVSSVATGLTSCVAIAWNPDGSQILSSVATGVTVLGILGGNLITEQVLSLPGASQLAVTSDGNNALVCVPMSNKVGVLVNTLDTWTVGSPLSVSDPVGVVILGTSGAYIISGTNLYPASRAGNTWALGTSIPLGFTGVAITVGAYGNVFVTGGTGTTGYLAMVSNGVLVSTATWSGNGHGISITTSEGQVAVLLSDNQTIRSFGAFNNAIVANGIMSLSAPSGCTFLGNSYESVWLCTPSQMWQSWWGKPYQIYRFKVGNVGVYNGSTWATAALGILHDPGAVSWDASGNVWVATTQNDLYSFSGTATGSSLPILSHGTISTYAGQIAGTPLGISSLNWYSGGLFGTTLFSGSVAQVQ